MRDKVFAALAVLIGIALPLAIGEFACRLLPVSDGLMAMPVNAAAPVFHFAPNRDVTWSRDWNFTIVNRIRVNNAGYVNEQDYDENDPRPLLAVIGDSYVEATMVPYRETLQGRLAAAVAPRRRVYSLAASGAPLSQYLVWAREARERWHAKALVIVVVGNDFDESLAVYKAGSGFHHYVVAAAGELVLRRFDFEPGLPRVIVRKSAFARYLFFNVQAQERVRDLANKIMSFASSARADRFVGNTKAAADPIRIARSEAAVRAFFRDLASYAGWPPGQVVIVVDGVRYPHDSSVSGSYFVRMREFLLAEARHTGYEAIDMDPTFITHFQRTGERYEFPTDGHWNGLAHRLAAHAVSSSRVFQRFQAEERSPAREGP